MTQKTEIFLVADTQGNVTNVVSTAGDIEVTLITILGQDDENYNIVKTKADITGPSTEEEISQIKEITVKTEPTEGEA